MEKECMELGYPLGKRLYRNAELCLFDRFVTL